jgi:CDP-ribitol ribitolphosphotransferase
VKKLCVTGISWERVVLRLETDTAAGSDGDSGLFLCGYGRVIPLRAEESGNCIYNLNISICDGGSFLANGEYLLCCKDAAANYVPAEISTKLVANLPDKAHVFRYGKRYAYTADFCVRADKNHVADFGAWNDKSYAADSGARDDEGDTASPRDSDRRAVLILRSHFMKINDSWAKPGRNAGFAMQAFYAFARSSYAILYGLHKLRGGRRQKKRGDILLMSEMGEGISSNIEALYSRLLERGMGEKYNIIISVRDVFSEKYDVAGWLKIIGKIARADYIFVDNFTPVFAAVHPAGGTKTIQIWHAGVGFKSVGLSRFGMEYSPGPLSRAHKAYDLAISPAPEYSAAYAEAFGMDETRILPAGLPRLDGFLAEDRLRLARERFFNAYNIEAKKTLILFAPTFRGRGKPDAHYDFEGFDFARMCEYCGDDKILLIHLHPYIKNRPDLSGASGRAVDVTEYPHAEDLLLVSGALITDYSSVYYDYSLLLRPIIFYCPDLALYEGTRGVHMPVTESAPGKVVTDFDGLMAALESSDYDFEKTLAFGEAARARMDGTSASDRIIDTVFDMGGEA